MRMGEANRMEICEAGPSDLNSDSSGGADEDCELTSNVLFLSFVLILVRLAHLVA